MLTDLFAGRAHTLGVGTHHFMDGRRSARGLRPGDEGAARFLRLRGRRKTQRQMETVSMCTMNEKVLGEVYDRDFMILRW